VHAHDADVMKSFGRLLPLFAHERLASGVRVTRIIPASDRARQCTR
jgi:hypothetical protein